MYRDGMALNVIKSRQSLHVIDSHTGGEPTRLVIGGGPEISGTLVEQRELLQTRHDWLRTSLILEPRGSDVLVGALLCPPANDDATAGVVFFNNAGYLNMCGHGTIGVIKSLEHLGRIAPGVHKLETVVGDVTATLHDTGEVSFDNVSSYRYRRSVPLNLADGRTVRGDIAWGGNWFFLVSDHGLAVEFENIPALQDICVDIRAALDQQSITGQDGGVIDHIELFGPSDKADSRSYVMCPGGEYDRSPCGTGTSAKVACLAADGRLKPGEIWRQESIICSQFSASYRIDPNTPDAVIPNIRGRAHVTAELTVIYDFNDPLTDGIRANRTR